MELVRALNAPWLIRIVLKGGQGCRTFGLSVEAFPLPAAVGGRSLVRSRPGALPTSGVLAFFQIG